MYSNRQIIPRIFLHTDRAAGDEPEAPIIQGKLGNSPGPPSLSYVVQTDVPVADQYHNTGSQYCVLFTVSADDN